MGSRVNKRANQTEPGFDGLGAEYERMGVNISVMQYMLDSQEKKRKSQRRLLGC